MPNGNWSRFKCLLSHTLAHSLPDPHFRLCCCRLWAVGLWANYIRECSHALCSGLTLLHLHYYLSLQLWDPALLGPPFHLGHTDRLANSRKLIYGCLPCKSAAPKGMWRYPRSPRAMLKLREKVVLTKHLSSGCLESGWGYWTEFLTLPRTSSLKGNLDNKVNRYCLIGGATSSLEMEQSGINSWSFY